MSDTSQANPPRPELIFGLAGPIGVNIDAICDSLSTALTAAAYSVEIIHLTREMLGGEYELRKYPVEPPSEKNFYTEIKYKIDYANALCREFVDPATLARVALREISKRRTTLTGNPKTPHSKPICYVVRQLKRPEEAKLLRQVYGKQFILISAYGPAEERQKLIEDRLRRTMPPDTPSHQVSMHALELIEQDASEDGNKYGQHLRDTFHVADVFIDGLSKQKMDRQLTRFISAFFGKADVAPTKSEYGMYAAKSASLRSSDLSRQIGAAIFSDDGEIITQGCNEVPKALGGTYWDTEEPDFRDVKLGYDPNEILKRELLRDLFDRMTKAELLSEKAKALGSPADMVTKLTKKSRSDDEEDGCLSTAAIMDVTEYGRVVHAEMCALCDAARLGRSVKGGTLYCTTFPCHNCAKHILAAGIKKVVYMEPYPKSRVKDLHQNEIEFEKINPRRVSFVPFLGISPFRYRDLFQKGRRKDEFGTARRWVDKSNQPIPMIDSTSNEYLELEIEEYALLVVQPAPAAQPLVNP
jgi:cytidine deaminase